MIMSKTSRSNKSSQSVSQEHQEYITSERRVFGEQALVIHYLEKERRNIAVLVALERSIHPWVPSLGQRSSSATTSARTQIIKKRF
jgi:hypothetical protein